MSSQQRTAIQQQTEENKQIWPNRVGDVIQKNQIESWNINDIILISAPTGRGKSFWVKTYLLSYCRAHKKKILWLTNRNILKDQTIRLTKNDLDIITIVNYQKIEHMVLNGKAIEEFDYIVSDECHYFFSDATFNRNTEVVFTWLLRQKNCIKILMSATISTTERYLDYHKKSAVKYVLESDYSFIDKFYFYNDIGVIEKLLSEMQENEKAIFFAGADKARYISKEFKNSAFICSSSNKNSKYSDEKTKEQIIDNEKFTCQILCTTSVLDNGVNIKDKQVKHIVVDYFDLDILQQCVGRKRILDNNDTIIIYIKNRNKKSLNGTKQMISQALKKAEYLKVHGEEEFIKKYIKKEYGAMIDVLWINGRPKVRYNNVMKIKYNIDLMDVNQMLNEDNGYINAVLKRFKWENKKFKILDNEIDKVTLENKLKKYINVKMFKKEQNEFKDFLLSELLNAPEANHGSIGLKTINALFDDFKLNYIVSSKEEKNRSSENRGKRHWIITRI